MCTFEIWKDDEMLVDNLSFEDAAEQVVIYQEFFGDDTFVAYRQTQAPHKSRAAEFRAEWFAYMDELYAMGNL